VRLARGSDTSIPALAADLAISAEALRHWLRQDNTDAGQGPPGALTSDEREELRRLRREVKVLQQERELLRKAAASCARETLIYWWHGSEAVVRPWRPERHGLRLIERPPPPTGRRQSAPYRVAPTTHHEGRRAPPARPCGPFTSYGRGEDGALT